MLVSLHGGHSGQFCCHAENMLEDIVIQYIKLGFTHVGISEHIPPSCHEFVYDDERKLALDPQYLFSRFESYIAECARLKKKYKDRIKIFIGFETEAWFGYEDFVRNLIKKFRPDYIVGSVHHINNICFDYSLKHYEEAISSAGGVEAFYVKYFDLQHAMILSIKPQVIGHFDLIRIFDEDYESRLNSAEIKKRIERNLDAIKEYDLILDYNQRSVLKGQKEPYPSKWILKKALSRGIKIVPGDDSHGVNQVGYNIISAFKILSNQNVILSERIFDNFF